MVNLDDRREVRVEVDPRFTAVEGRFAEIFEPTFGTFETVEAAKRAVGMRGQPRI